MILDSGLLTICTLQNLAAPGEMPKEQLVPLRQCYYGERTVGYGRQYAARGVNEQVDILARIWQDREARAGMYSVLDNGEQYRITNAQQLLDEDGLRVTDLSLERMDDLYDIAADPPAGGK